MKVRVILSSRVKDELRRLPEALRISIADALLDLCDAPTGPDVEPYGEIPGAYKLETSTFRALYTHGPEDLDHLTVWVLNINT